MSNNRILVVIFLIILSNLSFGLNPVYVSSKGSDSGDGTFSRPFLTLEKGRDFIRSKRSSGEQGPFSILLQKGDY